MITAEILCNVCIVFVYECMCVEFIDVYMLVVYTSFLFNYCDQYCLFVSCTSALFLLTLSKSAIQTL